MDHLVAFLPNGMRPLYVVAKPCVPADALRALDQCVPGIYLAQIDPQLPDAAAACAALDRFHCTVHVKSLEDFTFAVWDASTGTPLGDALTAEDLVDDPRDLDVGLTFDSYQWDHAAPSIAKVADARAAARFANLFT